MDKLLSAFKRHEIFFRNRKTKKLVISFFKPVSLYTLKKAYCPVCCGSRMGG